MRKRLDRLVVSEHFAYNEGEQSAYVDRHCSAFAGLLEKATG